MAEKAENLTSEQESFSQKKKKKNKNKATLPEGFDKEKAKLAQFDPRGVQTLFRTLSRNHYNLLRMVDSKASIILTINSIIISVLMGAMYIEVGAEKTALEISSKVLMTFSALSMICAVFSMLPHKYLGRRFNNSNYKGTLYAGNFANRPLEEYMAEFDRIMESGENIYDEMKKDLYFLGEAINRKQIMIVIAASIFILGLIVSVICFYWFARA